MSPLMIALSGCCSSEPPVWAPIEPVHLEGDTVTVDLAPLLEGRGDLDVVALESSDDVLASVSDLQLELTGQPGWVGTATVELVATDGCGNQARTVVEVTSGAAPVEGCPTVFSWFGTAETVHVAGEFNDWSETATPLTEVDGVWTVELGLAAGEHAYKLVVDGGAGPEWMCDPSSPWVQCDLGYKEPWDTSWSHTCQPGVASCNSVVRACEVPLTIANLDIDRPAQTVSIEVDRATFSVSVDGEAIDVGGNPFTLDVGPGRHVIELADGGDTVTVPVWMDDFRWEQATLYFAFIDRLHNGDPSNDTTEGATALGGTYRGGDFAGLREMLPYLDDLGVGVLWISNVQDNAEDAWAGDCGETYAGYHAYWPDHPSDIEEHFGDEAELHALIADAHGRGIRVVMDWVANHVHDTHPWASEHPEWFNAPANCTDTVDGQINFDRIPETCRFAPYLPDIDYSQNEPHFRMIDDAIGWATRLELDGFRVDAVKHMPHSVVYNLNTAIEARLEHRHAGGDERFWTVGETFDQAGQIGAYIDERQLDGQFDFPLYFSLRNAFADNGDLAGLFGAMVDHEARYAGALMSVFLGNHDVDRFTTAAAGQGGGACRDGGLQVAPVPTDPAVYDRLMLGLTVVFTQTGVPLVYYGDEFGMPGYNDPDNRQALWDHADLNGVSSVNDLTSELQPDQARVLQHVRSLAHARRQHPAFAAPGVTEWWSEFGVLGYSRSAGDDHVLVLVNREDQARTLENGLAFAGLPQGEWEDVLSSAVFTSTGDSIAIDLPPRTSRVLVHRE